MKFKKLMLVLTLTISIIFVIAIGTTYAYYNMSAGSISGTTGDIDTGLSVVFEGSNAFDFNAGVPIQFSDRWTKAANVRYNIYTNNMDFLDDVLDDEYDIYASIDFVNVDIDDALKVNDFKYYTNCHATSDGTYESSTGISNSGTGEDFSGQTFNSSKRLSILNIDSADFMAVALLRVLEDSTVSGYRIECVTYVWLEESGQNQNALMGKHFGANLEVNTMVKKR